MKRPRRRRRRGRRVHGDVVAPGNIVRVHDVAATRDVLRTIDALSGRTEVDPEYVLPEALRYERPAQSRVS